MTRRLTTDYAKNYCNRTLIIKSYCIKCSDMFWGHSVDSLKCVGYYTWAIYWVSRHVRAKQVRRGYIDFDNSWRAINW